MTDAEKLVDWMGTKAYAVDKRVCKTLNELREHAPQHVEKHLAVAKALLNDPPPFLVAAWEKRKKAAKKRK